MANLPSLTGREVIHALERAGFSLDRISSSHHIMKKSGHHNNVSVPVHGNKALKTGTLRAIIRSAGMTVDEFLKYL